MITLAETLKPASIQMELTGESLSAATGELLNLLRHDKRVGDWAELVDSVGPTDICIEGENGTSFCIPHARSRAVRQMVIAAGRRLAGIPMKSQDESSQKCHYVFLIGIPAAMDADYLRLIGLLARIFHDGAAVAQMNAAETGEELHAALSAAAKSF